MARIGIIELKRSALAPPLIRPYGPPSPRYAGRRARFDMPSLYGLLIIVFVIAGVGNLILGKVTGTSA